MDCFICREEEAVSREATWLRVGFEKANREIKPVCLEHTKRFEEPSGRTRDGWAVRMIADVLRRCRERSKVTAEDTLDDAVAYWQGEIYAVCIAVERTFPEQAKNVLPTMRSASDHYSFNRWGMYIGVEPDGHIHT